MSDVEKLREAMARAICCPSGPCIGKSLGHACEASFGAGTASAVLAAIDAAGFAVVPRMPTAEMIEAGRAECQPHWVSGTWHAMLTAAPKVLP